MSERLARSTLWLGSFYRGIGKTSENRLFTSGDVNNSVAVE